MCLQEGDHTRPATTVDTAKRSGLPNNQPYSWSPWVANLNSKSDVKPDLVEQSRRVNFEHEKESGNCGSDDAWIEALEQAALQRFAGTDGGWKKAKQLLLELERDSCQMGRLLDTAILSLQRSVPILAVQMLLSSHHHRHMVEISSHRDFLTGSVPVNS